MKSLVWEYFLRGSLSLLLIFFIYFWLHISSVTYWLNAYVISLLFFPSPFLSLGTWVHGGISSFLYVGRTGSGLNIFLIHNWQKLMQEWFIFSATPSFSLITSSPLIQKTYLFSLNRLGGYCVVFTHSCLLQSPFWTFMFPSYTMNLIICFVGCTNIVFPYSA